MNLTLADVLNMLQERVTEADSLRAAAKEIGVSPGYLSNVLHGSELPGPAILDPLGLKRIKVPPPPPEYVRING